MISVQRFCSVWDGVTLGKKNILNKRLTYDFILVILIYMGKTTQVEFNPMSKFKTEMPNTEETTNNYSVEYYATDGRRAGEMTVNVSKKAAHELANSLNEKHPEIKHKVFKR